MHDAFSKSFGGGGPRRKLAARQGSRFSPSYGVRNGLIKDPNWPPAQMPAKGNAAMRRSLRLKCEFSVRFGTSQPMATHGDISEGGAGFVLPAAVEGSVVEVIVQRGKRSVAARAEILSSGKSGDHVAYRARFTDAHAANEVWRTVFALA